MSATIPERCPKCGDELLFSSDTHREFMCFTVVLKDGKVMEGGECAKRQRDQLAERVKELEGKYNSLIMLVASKRQSETRHETAARYIREREGLQPLPACEVRNVPSEGQSFQANVIK